MELQIWGDEVSVIPEPVDVVFEGCGGYPYYYMNKNADF